MKVKMVTLIIVVACILVSCNIPPIYKNSLDNYITIVEEQNMGYSSLGLDRPDNFLPSNTFFKDYEYLDGGYHLYYDSVAKLKFSPEVVILYLKYDENNYFEAKEFTLESIPQNEAEVYYYDDYVFYLNKRPWGTDGAYNFTMACYNDVNHTLIFIGYDDGNPSLTEEEIENIGSNWKEFIDKNYGKYYDFES